MIEEQHVPVLLEEIVDFLNIKPNGVYLDGTLGCGGHAQKILEKLSGTGQYIGVDQDEKALEVARKRLRGHKNFTAIHSNFSNVFEGLKALGVVHVDGILLDLGVSSLQVDDPERGFSFQKEGPLDMRMNQQTSLSARDVVARYSEKDLADIIWEYGEERRSRRIARFIVQEREKNDIQTTDQLKRIIDRAYGNLKKRPKTHPSTKTFQAFRIFVNEELKNLQDFLKPGMSFLNPSGRMCVLSYHSLEDRIVKRSFRSLVQSKEAGWIVKKPLSPSEEEVMRNRRARSAKLRVIEKISEHGGKGI